MGLVVTTFFTAAETQFQKKSKTLKGDKRDIHQAFKADGMNAADEEKHQQQEFGWQAPPPPLQQPPAYGAAYNAQAGGISMQVPMQAPRVMYDQDPVTTVCTNCGKTVTTEVTTEIGVVAWIAAGSCCFAGLFGLLCFICAPIPLCMPSLRDVTHKCPNCNCVMGRYKAKLS